MCFMVLIPVYSIISSFLRTLPWRWKWFDDRSSCVCNATTSTTINTTTTRWASCSLSKREKRIRLSRVCTLLECYSILNRLRAWHRDEEEKPRGEVLGSSLKALRETHKPKLNWERTNSPHIMTKISCQTFGKQVFRKLGADFHTRFTNHPRMDERFERTNQMMEIALRLELTSTPDTDRVKYLPRLRRILNNLPCSSTGVSANEVIHGRGILSSLAADDLDDSNGYGDGAERCYFASLRVIRRKHLVLYQDTPTHGSTPRSINCLFNLRALITRISIFI